VYRTLVTETVVVEDAKELGRESINIHPIIIDENGDVVLRLDGVEMEAISEYYGVISNVHVEARVGIAFNATQDAGNNASPPVIIPVTDVSAIVPADDVKLVVHAAWFQIALEDVERQHKTAAINEVGYQCGSHRSQ
jgi:hypothetical protein